MLRAGSGWPARRPHVALRCAQRHHRADRHNRYRPQPILRLSRHIDLAQKQLHSAVSEDALNALKLADQDLARLIDQVPSRPFVEIASYESTFHALGRSIVYQQLAGKAAATIYGRVKSCLGGRLDAERLLATAPSELRAAGLSNNKMLALQDLATWQTQGRLPSRIALDAMDDEQVIAKLVGIRGVGRWTAQMLLMFWLQRPDVWPAGDFGVRKGYALLKRLEPMPDAKSFIPMGNDYRPYRSFAAWYMWRATELLD